MAKITVTVDKLNKRNSIPQTFADKTGIVGVVNKGFSFEGNEEVNVPNPALGKWYKDKDGYFYWGGGVVIVSETDNKLNLNQEQKDSLVTVRIENPLIGKLQIDKIWNDGEIGDMATVAILDSGISLQCTDLTEAVASGIDGGLNNAENRIRNFISNGASIEDDKGHGSHCAGLIASRNKNHTVGIAKGCKLYVGKISDKSNSPSVLNMIDGIRWAAGISANSPQDVDIISISNGSLLNRPDMRPSIIEAVGKGKIIVASIGNRNIKTSHAEGGNYPALFDEVISVGSVDNDNNFQNFSYQSPNLKITCPGTNIISYWIGGETYVDSGTSQSAAICSGVIALLVSKLKKRKIENIQEEIKKLLMNSPTSSFNGYPYRYIDPFQLYKSI